MGSKVFFQFCDATKLAIIVENIYILGTWGTCKELIENLMKIQCEFDENTMEQQKFNISTFQLTP